MKAIKLGDALWELEGVGDGEFQPPCDAGEVRRRLKSKTIGWDARIRLCGTNQMRRLGDLSYFRAEERSRMARIGVGFVTCLKLIPDTVFFLLFFLLTVYLYGKAGAFGSAGIDLPPADSTEPLVNPQFVPILLGSLCVLFVFRTIVHRIQRPSDTLPSLFFQQWKSLFALGLLALSMGAYSVVLIRIEPGIEAMIGKVEFREVINARWWIDVIAFGLLGLLFWVWFRVLRERQRFTNRPPDWLKFAEADVRESPFRSRMVARMILKAPIALTVSSFPGIFWILEQRLPTGNQDAVFLHFIGIMVVGGFFWIRLKAISRRWESRSPFSLLRSDPRPPVVFLRSFRMDKRSYGTFGAQIANEMVLEQTFAPTVGPFVAVGRPNECVPSLGAPRIYIKGKKKVVSPEDDKSWQLVVERLLKESSLVVFSAELDDVVPPEGIDWELRTALGLTEGGAALGLKRENVVLAVGKKDFATTYENFRQAFQHYFPDGLPEVEEVKSECLIAFPFGVPTVLKGNYSLLLAFANALGAPVTAERLADQLHAQDHFSGYAVLNSNNRDSSSSGETGRVFLWGAPVIGAGYFLSKVTDETGLFLIVGALASCFWSFRLRRGLTSHGPPLNQWKPIATHGILNQESVDPRVLFRRGAIGLVLFAFSLALLSSWYFSLDLFGDERGVLGVFLKTGEDGVVYIESVVPNSPASDLRLRSGDKILSVNGQSVTSEDEVSGQIGLGEPGTLCELVILRNSKVLKFSATLGSSEQVP